MAVRRSVVQGVLQRAMGTGHGSGDVQDPDEGTGYDHEGRKTTRYRQTSSICISRGQCILNG
jgi:hypothetical protein